MHGELKHILTYMFENMKQGSTETDRNFNGHKETL